MPSLLQRSASHHDKKNKKYNTLTNSADSAARRSEQSITDPAFFDPEHMAAPTNDELLEEMVVDASNIVPNGEAEVPGQDDGPWSVSVADAPSNNNKKKYTIYIQTPSQNLTLTRAAQEITDLHAKLRSNHPSATLPPLPGFPASGSDNQDGAKRRSSFLNTLSRLANPNPKPKPGRIGSASSITNASTPTIAPQSPIVDDPVSNMSQPTGSPPAIDDGTEQTMPALAAYLTLVSNHPIFRHSRAWRRFVRVRTDDLQSVRAERIVKRVRSESGLGRSGSQGGSAISLGRGSHDVRPGKPVPELPALPTMSSLDVRGSSSASDASEGIAEEDEDETARADKDLPNLPGSTERTPSNKPTALPDMTGAGSMPPVSEILASPSMQQAIATPLPPGTPEPPSTPLKKEATLPGVGGSTPTASEGQTLPTPGATPTPSPPRPNSSKVSAPAEHRLSSGSDVFANGSGSEADNNGFGGFGTETETEAELGADGETTADGVAIKVKKKKEKKPARKVVVDDFEMMRVLGKGCAGKVLLVRHRATTELYALKAITKRHVLAHQELQHTLTEQAVLKRMAREGRDPFVVKLWWSFHDKENLFLVMDFHPGGDLATQLARWGRLGRDRARFYAAEIVEGCEGLHAAGVIYRDLKPENILIGADGHIVLTDFGLSKEFPLKSNGQSPTAPTTPNGQTGFAVTPHWMDAAGSPGRASTSKRLDRDLTTTFCGTAEYLAPEVIQGLPYSYEVDWWSFGTMLYEMLTGITPFWANNHSDMYVRVLQDELQFPDDKAMDQDTKSLIRGLLQRNPALRMCEPRVKKHPYFSMIDWQHVYYKRYIPPYIPPIDPSNAGDTQNFDEAFLDMEPVIADETDQTDSEREDSDSESARTASGGKSPERPAADEGEEVVDVFDGYSFKGRDSIIIDDDESDESDEHEQEDERIRAAKVLEPEVDAGPITADEETTPHTTPADLPEAEREPVTPTTPTAEVPQPPVSEPTPASPVSKPRSPKPAASPALATSPALDVAQLPPLPAEKPDELAEPVVSPVTARAASPVLAPVTVTVPASAPAPAPALTPAPASALATEPSGSAVPQTKQKREKSGITALDRFLDADTDDDDDWDLVEKPRADEAAFNGRGGKSGNNLFARGVVDRYRLTVFRKASHPALNKIGRPQSSVEPKAPKAKTSIRPQSEASPSPAAEGSTSPTPSDSKRRGRSGGLSIRKSTRQFLRAKSPSASTALNNGSGLLSPAPSVPAVPSLKSKSSALSGTSPTSPGSSDPSIAEASGATAAAGPSGSQSAGELTDSDTLRRMPAVPESPVDDTKKSKKAKKSGPGNKMLSLFTLDTKR
ncbi:Agc agc-unique protein kinase [Rhizoctonia solani]|uniref:Agc agc-unique protein kinase n=1 Tax=Rhizoctonia solani TaxID=456999 RepID=A0A8H7LNG7_9AGAM|nr:Agc agc-unique protein kinase [Rhizoctonia solani]